MSRTIITAVPLMLFLALLQTAVFPYFPVFGYTPQLPFLVALAWGLLRGMEEGVVWAFVAGLSVDLFSVAPMGLTAVTFMAGVSLATLIAEALPPSRLFLPALLAVLSTILSLTLYFLLLWLIGFPTPLELIVSQLPVSILHGGMILPIYWLTYLIDRTVRPRRVQI